MNAVQPVFADAAAIRQEENCTFIGTTGTYDVWYEPTHDTLIIQLEDNESNYRAVQVKFARELAKQSAVWQCAVALYSYQTSQAAA